MYLKYTYLTEKIWIKKNYSSSYYVSENVRISKLFLHDQYSDTINIT